MEINILILYLCRVHLFREECLIVGHIQRSRERELFSKRLCPETEVRHVMYHRLASHARHHYGKPVVTFLVSCALIQCPHIVPESVNWSLDTAFYHVLAGTLILVGIIRAYFGDVLKAVSVFIDGCIFGLLLSFYIVYSTNADIPEGTFFPCSLFYHKNKNTKIFFSTTPQTKPNKFYALVHYSWLFF